MVKIIVNIFASKPKKYYSTGILKCKACSRLESIKWKFKKKKLKHFDLLKIMLDKSKNKKGLNISVKDL
jgi:hypothetical protein